MPYATVTLPTMVLLNPADPETDRINVLAWDRDVTHTKSGLIEKYAANRKVGYVFPGRTDTWELVLYHLSQDDWDRLLEWVDAGAVICIRDRHKRKTFGMSFQAKVKDYKDEAYDVTLVIEDVTYVEGSD